MDSEATRQPHEDVRSNCNVVNDESFSAPVPRGESQGIPLLAQGTMRDRIRGGRLVTHHLCDILELREADARKIAVDSEADIAKRMAAKWALRALSDDLTRGGIPIAGYDMERIMDRTVGRPSQQVNVIEEHKTINVINLTREALEDALGSLAID